MRVPVAVTAALLGTLLACSRAPDNAPVPISGEPADIASLEGDWAGEYHSYAPARRSGTLFFRITAAGDTARGDALMHTAGRETAGTTPYMDPWTHAARSQVLTVTFVRGAGSTVMGRLDPHNDPVCGCEIHTTFTGHIKGNLLEGTYTSEHAHGGDASSGRWRVLRRLP